MHLGSTGWKLKRLTAGQEELDSNDFFNETKEFSLQESKVLSITAKAERKTFSIVDNHATFEFEIPKSALSTAQETVVKKLNLTSVTFWPYADNTSFSFECIVQVEPKRPYSGWREIDFYNVKIRSKKEVVIETAIAQGIAGWDLLPDPGADPTTTGTAGWDLLPKDLYIAYYPFNGNPNDESGNGYNGTVYGATLTDGVKGNTNTAYSFSKATSNNYIDMARAATTNEITITVWFRRSDTTDGWIINNRTSASTVAQAEYQLYFYQGANLAFSLWNSNGDITTTTFSSVLNSTTDTWTFASITVNSSGVVNVYKNAVLDGTGILSGAINTGSLFTRIGKPGWMNSLSPTELNFNGSIDNIRIYGKALSIEEILTIYNEEKA